MKNKLISAKKYVITILVVSLIGIYLIISKTGVMNPWYQNVSYCKLALPFIHINYDKLSASDLAFVHTYLQSGDDTYIKKTIASNIKGSDPWCHNITHIQNNEQIKDLKQLILSQSIQYPEILFHYRNILFNTLMNNFSVHSNQPIASSFVIFSGMESIFIPLWSNNSNILNPYLQYFNAPILSSYFHMSNPLVYMVKLIFMAMLVSIFFMLQLPFTAMLSIAMALRMLVLYFMIPAPFSDIYLIDLAIFFNFIFILMYIEWKMYRKSKIIKNSTN